MSELVAELAPDAEHPRRFRHGQRSDSDDSLNASGETVD